MVGGLLATLIVVGAACGGGGTARQVARPVANESPLVGRPAPALDLEELSSTTNLGVDVGDVTLIRFWASWCQACRRDEGLYRRVRRSLKERDVTMLGIATFDSKERVAEHIRRHPPPFASTFDRRSRVGRAYGLISLPAVFLIDADGVVGASLSGGLNRTALEDAIRSAHR
jgi:cytochrome c biogenesis protein CcmG/thiol:disulfide interchange protein DsbE